MATNVLQKTTENSLSSLRFRRYTFITTSPWHDYRTVASIFPPLRHTLPFPSVPFPASWGMQLSTVYVTRFRDTQSEPKGLFCLFICKFMYITITLYSRCTYDSHPPQLIASTISPSWAKRHKLTSTIFGFAYTQTACLFTFLSSNQPSL